MKDTRILILITLICLVINSSNPSTLWTLISLAMIVYTVKTFINNKKAKEYEPAEQIIKESNITSKRINKGILDFNVAGVTFSNDDGTRRQTAIKNLYKNQYPINESEEDEEQVINADICIEQYEYNGEPAYSIVANGKCIGNMPKSSIKDYQKIESSVYSTILSIGSFINDEGKKTWFAKLKLNYTPENNT